MIKKETRNRLILFGCIIAVLILTGIAIFSQPYKAGSDHYFIGDYEESSAPVDYGTQYVNVSVNDFTFTIDSYADGAVYDTAWLTTEYDTVVTLGEFSGCNVWVNGMEVQPNSAVSFRVEQLTKDSYIDLKFSSINAASERSIKIRTLNSTFPDYQVYSNSEQNEDFCFSIPDSNYIAKMDRNGNVLFYRLGAGASNFTQHNVDGKIRYSYMETTGGSLAEYSGYKAYKGVVLNEQYNVIDIVERTLPVDDGRDIFGLCADGFEYIDDSHYLTASLYSDYCEPTSSGNYRVAVTRIQEIDQGSVVWNKDIYDPDMADYIKLSEPTDEETTDISSISEREQEEQPENLPAFVDLMGLSMLQKSESGKYSFCLFKNVGVVCRMDSAGTISNVIAAPEGYEIRSLNAVSDEKLTLMMSSVLTNETVVMDYLLSNNSAIRSNEDIIGYSSGYGSLDKAKSGSVLIGWGDNCAPEVEFTEFAADGGKVTFELITSENSGVVIDSVSYAERGGEAA